MSRDIEDRLCVFGAQFKFIRIALNMDQVNKYGPPPNPAKLTDSRATTYINKYGPDSWELDALEPKAMEKLIKKAILKHRNARAWAKRAGVEEDGQDALLYASQRWEDVETFLKS